MFYYVCWAKKIIDVQHSTDFTKTLYKNVFNTGFNTDGQCCSLLQTVATF